MGKQEERTERGKTRGERRKGGEREANIKVEEKSLGWENGRKITQKMRQKTRVVENMEHFGVKNERREDGKKWKKKESEERRALVGKGTRNIIRLNLEGRKPQERQR